MCFMTYRFPSSLSSRGQKQTFQVSHMGASQAAIRDAPPGFSDQLPQEILF
jgi:hypothetical protein